MIHFLGFCVVATVLQAGEAGTTVSSAERLLASAEKNRLSDAEAQQAAELLDHRHPFVRDRPNGRWPGRSAMRTTASRRSGRAATRRPGIAAGPRWRARSCWKPTGCGRPSSPGCIATPRLAASAEALVQRAQRMAIDFRRQGLRAEADARLERLLDELRAASSCIRRCRRPSPMKRRRSRPPKRGWPPGGPCARPRC